MSERGKRRFSCKGTASHYNPHKRRFLSGLDFDDESIKNRIVSGGRDSCEVFGDRRDIKADREADFEKGSAVFKFRADL